MAGVALGCVEIPVFTADDVVSGHFVTDGLPTDGSIVLAILRLDPAFGSWPGGLLQHLLFWTGSPNGQGVNYNSAGGGGASSASVPGWSLVA